MALKLTQQELAVITGVSQKEVDLFEHNFPVRLEAKHKLLKELWAARYVLYKTFSPAKKH